MSKPTTRHHDARRRARCSGAQTVVTGRSDVLPVPPCRSGLGTTHPPYPVPPPCPASAASAAGRDPSATPHASPLHQQTAGHTQTRPSGGTGMRNAPSGAHRGGPRQTGRDGAGLDEYAAGNPPDVFGAGAGKESQQPSLGATPQSSGTGGGHGEGASRRPLPLARAFGTQHGERSPASTPPPPLALARALPRAPPSSPRPPPQLSGERREREGVFKLRVPLLLPPLWPRRRSSPPSRLCFLLCSCCTVHRFERDPCVCAGCPCLSQTGPEAMQICNATLPTSDANRLGSGPLRSRRGWKVLPRVSRRDRGPPRRYGPQGPWRTPPLTR